MCFCTWMNPFKQTHVIDHVGVSVSVLMHASTYNDHKMKVKFSPVPQASLITFLWIRTAPCVVVCFRFLPHPLLSCCWAEPPLLTELIMSCWHKEEACSGGMCLLITGWELSVRPLILHTLTWTSSKPFYTVLYPTGQWSPLLSHDYVSDHDCRNWWPLKLSSSPHVSNTPVNKTPDECCW